MSLALFYLNQSFTEDFVRVFHDPSYLHQLNVEQFPPIHSLIHEVKDL
jgi:hypothetical protein